MSRRAQIGIFLTLVTAASAVLYVLIVRAGGLDNPASGNLVRMLMWAPGLVAILVTLIATRSLRGLGWWPRLWSPLLVGWLAPIFYGGTPFVIAGLIGAGTFDFSYWAAVGAARGFGPSPVAGVAVLAIIGTLISLLSATGEEIGWRGFLVPALYDEFGFWPMAGVSGTVWALYHLPLIPFAGYAGDGTPLWFSILCFTGMVFVMTPLLAVLRLRSGTFWATALMHASHNLFIQSVFAKMLIPNATTPWLVGEFGLLTPLACAIVVAVYFWRTGLPEGRVHEQKPPRVHRDGF